MTTPDGRAPAHQAAELAGWDQYATGVREQLDGHGWHLDHPSHAELAVRLVHPLVEIAAAEAVGTHDPTATLDGRFNEALRHVVTGALHAAQQTLATPQTPAAPLAGPPGEVVRATTAVDLVLDAFQELAAHTDPLVLAGLVVQSDRLLDGAAAIWELVRARLTATVDQHITTFGGAA